MSEPGTRLPESRTRWDLWYATLAGIAGVAGSYAVAGASRQFVIAPIDALVVDLTPGGIVAFMIQNVGEEAHLLHVGISIAVATALLAAASTAGLLTGRRVGRSPVGVGVAGLLAWVLTTVLTGSPLLALGAAVPVATFTAVGVGAGVGLGTAGARSVDTGAGSDDRGTKTDSESPGPARDPTRRRILVAAAGALAFVGAAVGLGQIGGRSSDAPADGDPVDEAVATLLDDAEGLELDVAGDVPGLVSPATEFFNTDIAQFDPDLPADGWEFTITGEVDTERTVTFAELTDMPTEHTHNTLRCVGESLNGHKLDNAVWTGTPLKPLLDEVDPEGTCGCAMLHAEDGYFVQFPVAALEEGYLVWKMNGRPLPKSHGHPVRVLVPGHWGETNAKWLSEIELLEEEADGYWEQRGWHGTGPVETVAKLWSDTVLEDGRIEVAGHAYAGIRGVDRVEVSTDGGETWTDAELSDPLPGTDVWRQWRYVFDPDGRHEVVVRAIDGEGTLQPETEADAFPSGATGWVRKTVSA